MREYNDYLDCLYCIHHHFALMIVMYVHVLLQNQMMRTLSLHLPPIELAWTGEESLCLLSPMNLVMMTLLLKKWGILFIVHYLKASQLCAHTAHAYMQY